VTTAAYGAFLEARLSNTCTCDGESADCVDLPSADRTLEWNGYDATTRSVCAAVAGGPMTQSCAEHPMREVTWCGCSAFCTWLGGRLCSEAEWERAATGTSHRLYPWGPAAPDGSLANGPEVMDGWTLTSPVGSFPAGASAVGALDMAGNLFEWVEDDWHTTYDAAGRPDDGSPWVDTPRAVPRVVRGGAYLDDVDRLRTSWRDHVDYRGAAFIGTRCCWTPDP